MPTTATSTFSAAACEPAYNSDDAMASMEDVTLKASTTFAAGQVIGKVTATGRYAPYASGNSDGSQGATGILRRAAVTDANGAITNYDEWGNLGLVGSMFTQGSFKIADLTGLDDNAVAVLGGHLDGVDVAHSTYFTF